jgi:hypothetical protein
VSPLESLTGHDYGHRPYYAHVPSSESFKVITVVLSTGLLKVLRVCRLLASAVAAKFKQRTVSLLQLHDRHKRKQPVCVCVCFPTIPLTRRSCFHSFSVFLTSPPVNSIAILNVMADSHKQTSDPIPPTQFMSHRSRISQPRFNGFTGPLEVINRTVYGFIVLRDNSITTEPALILKTQF